MTSTSTTTTMTAAVRLPLHADAAAFLRDDDRSSETQLLAVSTYELVSRGKREGGIHLFDTAGGTLSPLVGVGGREEGGESGDVSPPFPGVFDIKWLRDLRTKGRPPTLVAALSDGSVRLMRASPPSSAEGEEGGRGRWSLTEVARCLPLFPDDGGDEGGDEGASFSSGDPFDDPSAMALFVDVEISRGETEGDNQQQRLAASFSDGRVAVLEASTRAGSTEAGPRTKLRTANRWRAHEAECWCVSFSPESRETLYTGADDCEMFAWDLREVSGATARPRPAWRAGQGGRGGDEKHGAGVCCVSPSPSQGRGHLVASGSYDGVVRVWDARKPSVPVFLGSSPTDEGEEGGAATSSSSPPPSRSLGGGAWRLVWHPGGRPYLLCAAMHAGFAVLRVRGGGERGGGEEEGERATPSSPAVVVERRYREHGADPSPLNGGAATLAYGCDWRLVESEEDEEKLRVATASFYDNAVHLWECRSLGGEE